MRWMTTWIACCMVAYATNVYAQEWEQLRFVPPSTELRGVSITDRFIFAVGHEGTIVRSDDFGETWRLLQSEIHDWRRVQFQTDSVGWICGNYGTIARTTDAGLTWTESVVFSGDVRDIWSADGVRAVAVGDRGYVAVTTDAAESWTIIVTGEGDIYDDLLAVDFINENVGCAVGGYSMLTPPVILLTGDGGLTWEPIETPQIGWLAGVAYASDSVIVAVGKFGNVLRSGDGGLTWDSVYAYDQNNASLRDIDFADSANGSAVANDGAYITTSNGGLTWTLRGMDPNALHGLDLTSDGIGVAVGDFGASFTGDYGVGWSDQVPLPCGAVYAVDFADDHNGWLLVQHNYVYRTHDTGQAWSYSLVPCAGTVHQLAAVSDSIAVVGSDLSEIYRTDNAGRTWQLVYPDNSSPVTAFCFANEDTGYATTNDGDILATFDGGLNWVVQYFGESTLLSVQAIDAQHVWAVGEDGVVLRNYDTEGWVVHTTFPTQSIFVGIDFADTLSGVIIGNSGTTIYTSDGGEEWRYADSQLHILTKVELADPLTGWLSGYVSFVAQTIDGGATWTSIPVGANVDLFDMTLTDTQVWVVGQNGAVFRREYILHGSELPEISPQSFSLSAYPNPFNSTATLQFDLPRESRVEIALYDVLGREAMKLTDEIFTAGTHRLSIDAATLASGVYFAKLSSPDFSTTAKLLLLR